MRTMPRSGWQGTSPHTRRKLACAVTTVLNDGDISTYAEKTWGFKIAISDRVEHLHARGENTS